MDKKQLERQIKLGNTAQGWCIKCKGQRTLVAGMVSWLVGLYCGECGSYKVIPDLPERDEYKTWLVAKSSTGTTQAEIDEAEHLIASQGQD